MGHAEEETWHAEQYYKAVIVSGVIQNWQTKSLCGSR